MGVAMEQSLEPESAELRLAKPMRHSPAAEKHAALPQTVAVHRLT